MSAGSDPGAIARRRLGRSDCRVTTLGLGTAELGNLYAPISHETAAAIVDEAWQGGIRFFDTAPYYGFGLSERRLGDALRERLDTSVVLSTKVGRLLRPHAAAATAERHGFFSPMPFEPVYDYSYDGVMRSYEASIQRLGVARIDVLLVHDIGTATHGSDNAHHLSALRDSGARALEELRAAGVVRATGLGVNEVDACLQALDWGSFDCFLLAGRYTLLEQEPLKALMPRLAAAGVSLIVGGVFNSGILATGTHGADRRYYNYQPAGTAVLQKVRRLEDICDAHAVALAAAAIQFPLAHPVVASVIPGVSNPAEVASAIGNARARIPASFWSDLKAEGLLEPSAPVPAERGDST